MRQAQSSGMAISCGGNGVMRDTGVPTSGGGKAGGVEPIGIRDLPEDEYQRARRRIRKQVELSPWRVFWDDLMLILGVRG